MTRSTMLRAGATAALAGALLAACGGTGTASPSAAPSVEAPSIAESPAGSPDIAGESPSASAAASPSASPSGAAVSPGTRVVQVYGLEGGFQNLPIDPTPGTVLTFRNVGSEAHELVILRRNDDAGEDQTFASILEDPTTFDPAALMDFVTVVGVLAADPGQEAQGQIELTETGDYLAVDLLPQGTATAPASPDPMAIPSGVPNAAAGTIGTFTVIEPEAS
jgi:hypothetical protein